jgi:hypothetical protein
MNTLALVQEHHRVSFVSANTSDYSENGGLHPDLEKDLAPVLPEHVHFRYFKGLNEFIAFMGRDGDAGAEVLRDALMSEGYRGFHLDYWLIDNLDDLLCHYELDGIAWTALPYWAENPRLVALDELVGIEVHGERTAGADLVEFYCDLALLGPFTAASCSQIGKASSIPAKSNGWMNNRLTCGRKWACEALQHSSSGSSST